MACLNTHGSAATNHGKYDAMTPIMTGKASCAMRSLITWPLGEMLQSLSRNLIPKDFDTSIIANSISCLYRNTVILQQAIFAINRRSARGGVASLRYRNRAEISALMCERKPYPVEFSRRSNSSV